MRLKSFACIVFAASSATVIAQDAGSFHPLPVEEIYTAMHERKSYVWTNAALRDAIGKAISFEATSQTIAQVSEELMTAAGGEKRAALFRTLGTNNLSSFLMTVTGPNTKQYEIEQDVSLFAFVAAQRALAGRSAVLLDDITEHHVIRSEPTRIGGQFLIDIPKSLRTRCVYTAHQEGNSWAVRRLVIARRHFHTPDEGLTVIEEDSNHEVDATGNTPIGSQAQ
jgi:hypothetical protein